MPRSICQVCATPIPAGSSRCPDHARARRPFGRPWRRLRDRILERDAHRCRYCGGRATTVDHVRPVDQGGTDDAWNLVAACRTCNESKGARTPQEWRGRVF
jgi:5-methylcytosine-specific restriction endonuclease McrA